MCRWIALLALCSPEAADFFANPFLLCVPLNYAGIICRRICYVLSKRLRPLATHAHLLGSLAERAVVLGRSKGLVAVLECFAGAAQVTRRAATPLLQFWWKCALPKSTTLRSRVVAQ